MKPASIRAAVVALAVACPAGAQESRPFSPIPRPGAATPQAAAAAAVRAAPPLPAALRRSVMESVELFAKAWNTPALRAMLGETFQDRQRVVDALITRVPRDAVLRVLAVEDMQLVSREVRTLPSGIEQEVVTKVAVTLRTQVEFNDPRAGFQRLEGRNQAVFTFREVL